MITTAYLVSAEELARTCEMSDPKYVMTELHDKVSLKYTDPDDFLGVNSIIYKFPLNKTLNSMGRRVFLIGLKAAEHIQGQLYKNKAGDLIPDTNEDWIQFWVPLAARLQYKAEQQTRITLRPRRAVSCSPRVVGVPAFMSYRHLPT